MIEIMLGVWAICFALSALTLAYGIFLTKKRLHSHKLQAINTNLAKVGLFWSNATSDFEVLQENSINEDQRKTLRSAWMAGLLGLGSVPGFLLLFAITISVHFIARSRKENSTFQSALAANTQLSPQEVQVLVNDLKKVY